MAFPLTDHFLQSESQSPRADGGIVREEFTINTWNLSGNGGVYARDSETSCAALKCCKQRGEGKSKTNRVLWEFASQVKGQTYQSVSCLVTPKHRVWVISEFFNDTNSWRRFITVVCALTVKLPQRFALLTNRYAPFALAPEQNVNHDLGYRSS